MFQIPPEFSDTVPHPKLSLQSLLKRMRGVVSGSAQGRTVDECFSADRPNASLEETREIRIIPPKTILDEMDKFFGQLWFDGKANSIIDWTHRAKRYPLAVFTVYWELNRACAIRAEWTRASQWLNSKVNGDSLQAVQTACNLMYAYEWDREPGVRDVRMPVKELLSMLGNSWLSDEHIDSLMCALTSRYEAENGLGHVVFAPCIFQHWIRQLHEGSRPAGLQKYNEWISAGIKRVLYFIAHINSNHWVAWKVDLESKVFGHGQLYFLHRCNIHLLTKNEADSMNLPEEDMLHVRRHLEAWTRGLNAGSEELAYRPGLMARGDQTGDTISCGIIAYNAVARDVFGDELWSPSKSKRYRIEAFNEIVREQIEQVSVCIAMF